MFDTIFYEYDDLLCVCSSGDLDTGAQSLVWAAKAADTAKMINSNLTFMQKSSLHKESLKHCKMVVGYIK